MDKNNYCNLKHKQSQDFIDKVLMEDFDAVLGVKVKGGDRSHSIVADRISSNWCTPVEFNRLLSDRRKKILEQLTAYIEEARVVEEEQYERQAAMKRKKLEDYTESYMRGVRRQCERNQPMFDAHKAAVGYEQIARTNQERDNKMFQYVLETFERLEGGK